jgi:hypothetical protein
MTAEVSAADASIERTPAASMGRRRWVGQVPRDVVLIVAGALLAFASDEWRDARHRRAHVDAAVASVHDELILNRRLVDIGIGGG